jgi:hypothetical protein
MGQILGYCLIQSLLGPLGLLQLLGLDESSPEKFSLSLLSGHYRHSGCFALAACGPVYQLAVLSVQPAPDVAHLPDATVSQFFAINRFRAGYGSGIPVAVWT